MFDIGSQLAVHIAMDMLVVIDDLSEFILKVKIGNYKLCSAIDFPL